MAIQKTFSQPSGLEYGYHKVSVISVNTITKKGSCVVQSFISSQTRLDGKKPVDIKSYNLPDSIFTTLDLSESDARALAYTHLKTLPEFSGAVDV